MTLPTERYWAVNNVREFLYSLLTAPRIPKEIRIRARDVLKHYPTEYDMDVQIIRDREIFDSPDI